MNLVPSPKCALWCHITKLLASLLFKYKHFRLEDFNSFFGKKGIIVGLPLLTLLAMLYPSPIFASPWTLKTLLGVTFYQIWAKSFMWFDVECWLCQWRYWSWLWTKSWFCWHFCENNDGKNSHCRVLSSHCYQWHWMHRRQCRPMQGEGMQTLWNQPQTLSFWKLTGQEEGMPTLWNQPQTFSFWKLTH